ncbi:hypothetical protein [Serratia sp. M24T3]|uniref:Uncharacterized protein n=1 Tax=Rouxiella sp. WC2420 TaxID=3234145 RepID=A0AB39VV79_9GAMM|nr:hypothetical protein [Serratia sp. M24T3]
MKVLDTMEVEQVVGAGGFLTDTLGTVIGAVSNVVSPLVGQTVQSLDNDVDGLLKLLITF